jgi:hypothetical protein
MPAPSVTWRARVQAAAAGEWAEAVTRAHGRVQKEDAFGDELVHVAVPGHDQDVPASRHLAYQGSDDVVGLGVLDLDPADLQGLKELRRVRRPRRPHRVLLRRYDEVIPDVPLQPEARARLP